MAAAWGKQDSAMISGAGFEVGFRPGAFPASRCGQSLSFRRGHVQLTVQNDLHTTRPGLLSATVAFGLFLINQNGHDD
jgi:hypothetical protein